MYVLLLYNQGAEEIDLTGKKTKEEVTEMKNQMQSQASHVIVICKSCDIHSLQFDSMSDKLKKQKKKMKEKMEKLSETHEKQLSEVNDIHDCIIDMYMSLLLLLLLYSMLNV